MGDRSGVSRTQVGYAHVGKPFPVEVRVKLGERQAYEPGDYVTGPDCYYIADGELTVRFSDLVPAPKVTQVRQA